MRRTTLLVALVVVVGMLVVPTMGALAQGLLPKVASTGPGSVSARRANTRRV